MREIVYLCEKYTSLFESDIKELIKTAQHITEKNLYADADVFIDVYNEMTQEALVVYHKRPKNKESLYQKRVIGQAALLENEPGVMRTMETSLNTIGLMALSQENRPIRQNIYPIRNNKKTIGVIIVEKDIIQEFDGNFAKAEQSNGFKISNVIKQIYQVQEGFVDQLAEAILIYNDAGILISSNQVAKELYRKLGYRTEIYGMHYDNLTLDYTTFEYSLYQFKNAFITESLNTETTYLSYHFKIKRIWIESEAKLIVIIQDDTAIKEKEAEIVSKSAAIREIHHRVKNNLQSVVSLLRIQERRTKSTEAKKVLKESVGRIMAIAATHELLSKQVEDQVSLIQTLEAVVYNFRHIFSNSREIEWIVEIDPKIYVQSDQMVTISLIVNELIQNIFDHAYASNEKGKIKLSGQIDDYIICIKVQDNGHGYDAKAKYDSSLGLMIVNSYVKDKLKGKIKTESNEQGTTTCFYFEKNTNDVV
ncbi:histidine kinase N-terminal domain-containing protein [Enterococcus mediterraneensis]|uniref:histidine kinase N-terminal domain-containing protein n=1 Tax=Enterococcus mediterraneensis TaxID=2364791 RepID=UPI0019D087A4